MALLSFRGFDTPSLPTQGEQRRSSYFNIDRDIPLAAPDTRTEALDLLRGLIERVVLRPAEKGFEVELVGEIAAMVDLGAQNETATPKGAAVPAVYRRSVALRVRNHLELLL